VGVKITVVMVLPAVPKYLPWSRNAVVLVKGDTVARKQEELALEEGKLKEKKDDMPRKH